jgi:RHS repeat-associated protein
VEDRVTAMRGFMGYRRLLGVMALLGAVVGTPAASAPTPAATLEFYHLDALGSVRVVSNEAGEVVRTHNYFPFGDGSDGTQPGADPLRFTGKERDGETGLDYFGARYYGSRTGRFTSVDPAIDIDSSLRAPQHWNRYAYVANNPTRWTDPDGRCTDVLSCTLAFGAAGAAGGAVVGGPPGALIAGIGGALAGGVVAIGTLAILQTPPSMATDASEIHAPKTAFTPKTKAETDAAAGGKCEYCGVAVVPGKKAEKGVTPPRNQRETDHYVPESKGGSSEPVNAVNSCKGCNRGKSDTFPQGTKWELERLKSK